MKNLETDLTPPILIDALENEEKRQKLRELYTKAPKEKRHFEGTPNRVSMSLYSGPRSTERVHWEYTPRRIMNRKEYVCRCLCGDNPNPVAWMGTGDAELKGAEVREAWRRSYKRFLPNVATLLLPHHGSDGNFSPDLLEPDKGLCNLIWCLAAAGDPSPYPHPGISVIESVRHNSKGFRHVSQRPRTLFCEKFWV